MIAIAPAFSFSAFQRVLERHPVEGKGTYPPNSQSPYLKLLRRLPARIALQGAAATFVLPSLEQNSTPSVLDHVVDDMLLIFKHNELALDLADARSFCARLQDNTTSVAQYLFLSRLIVEAIGALKHAAELLCVDSVDDDPVDDDSLRVDPDKEPSE